MIEFGLADINSGAVSVNLGKNEGSSVDDRKFGAK